MSDSFGDYLASLTCVAHVEDDVQGFRHCGRRADHRQAGKLLCNQHLDNSPRAPRAFATND